MMSYDVWLKNNDVLECNFSYNLQPMFEAAALSTTIFHELAGQLVYSNVESLKTYGFTSYDGDDFDGWNWSFNNLHGKSCRTTLEILAQMLNRMVLNRKTYEAFNPENGWGNYDQAVGVLILIILACNKYPDDTLMVG